MRNKSLRRVRWETECSDIERLQYVSLVYKNDLEFVVRDENNEYQFTFSNPGPHMLADESLRAELYQDAGPVGSTFTIENSDLVEMFNPSLFSFSFQNQTPIHYVIGTDDLSLEILATHPPIIKRTSRIK